MKIIFNKSARMRKSLFFLLTLLLILTACSPAGSPVETDRLQVVATTTLIGDVVGQVGGELIELTVLLPPGADPHSYQPNPQDLAVASRTGLIFINGLGLEEFMTGLLEGAGVVAEPVSVSDGIQPLQLAEPEAGEEAEHGGQDPHVWTDPNNVLIWVDNIERALAAADPANAALYAANAESYRQSLRELDEWVRQQVSSIPVENRRLVSDHLIWGYFAERYGFTQVGALIPGYSTSAAPSAQELAALEDAVRAEGVKAILVSSEINPSLAQRLAEDTGIELVLIYSGSLGGPGSGVESYLDYIRYTVSAAVAALAD